MTDNEIKKALECCANDDSCENCPLKGKKLGKGCLPVKGFYNQIVDLLNRKDEMINGLIAGQETLQKGIAERDKEIERLEKSRKEQKHALFEQQSYTAELQSKNDKLLSEEKALLVTIEKMRNEIRRLQIILVNFMDEIYAFGNKNNVDTNSFAQIAILGNEKDNVVKQIKSEAYTELVDKLIDAINKDISLYGNCTVHNMALKINNLLKEMEGETNGR